MSTTRIYTGSSGSNAISPAVDAAWDRTTELVRVAGDTTKPNVTNTAITTASLGSGTLLDVALLQVVYPLTTGTQFRASVDTLHAYFQASQSSGATDAAPILSARVIASNGTTVQATLMTPEAVTGSNPTNEFASPTLTSRRFPRASASDLVENDYTAVSGDYLVVEVGGRKVSSTNTSISLRYGSASGSTDLAENETQTGASLCPWIEFTWIQAASGVSVRSYLLE